METSSTSTAQTETVVAGGVRIRWPDLPTVVRSAVENLLSGTVVGAVSQSGGFSPGSADRLLLADGRRAFAKTVSRSVNTHAFELHRAEAQVAAVLPAGTPTPKFLGSWNDDDWVALCFADVEGRHPLTPWEPTELEHTLETLARLAGERVDLAALPNQPAAVNLAHDFAGWERIAARPPASLPILAAQHLDELRALASRSTQVCRGDALCHLDIRADNLLVEADGTVLIVDWPWACAGAPWIDSLLLLVNVGLYGGHDLEELIARSPVLSAAAAADIDAFLAGLAGYFVDSGREPDPPGLPTLRRFQRQQGDVVLNWLARRRGW